VKIRAIRLKEVGRFSEPIALEGLSGDLDVLAGPNEFGKSTILKAVRLALCEKHTSKDRKTVEALRPHNGGAPLVEVDFEIAGNTWRIRKQFLAGRSAELRSLSGSDVARGGDAETKLAELLAGKDAAGRFALLWVDQGKPLAPPSAEAAANGALLAAVEDEVESVTDGGAARFVSVRLKAGLAELVTGHNPPRPTGRYKTALDEQRSLEARRDAARARLASAQARLERLGGIRERIARLADPAAATARVQAKADAERAFETGRAAYQKLRVAEEALEKHEERFHSCETALESLKAKIADLSKFEEAAAREAPQLAELTKRLAEQESRTEAARKKRDEIKEALAAAEREGKAHVLGAQLRDLAERLKAARDAAGQRKGLTDALAANGAADGLLTAARNAAQSIAMLSARLEAAAPKVSIAYARGGAGKIRVAGKVVADGETIHPTRAIALEIEGIGVITIAPGQSEGAEDDAADSAALQAQLSDLLREMGAASIEDAERRTDERRALQTQLAEVNAQLRARAPDGLERLEAVHAELAKRTALLGPAPIRSQEEQALRAQDLGEALSAAEADLAGAVAARDETRIAEVKQRALAAERGDHIKRLAAELGDAAARKAKLDKLAAALTEATTARNAAVRDATAWREAAPDETRFAALKRASETAAVAVSAAEKELSDLHRIEAGIEGELKADRTDDVGSTLAELDDACAAADERVRGLAQELGALQLLSRELDKAAGETRERLSKPVLDRLEPYLRLVFPGARLSFGDAFALETLQRGSAAEEITTLSEGTREQLAVLVRLGFGRLLAEAGNAAPLILDDALVYSDDARIERMFEALKLAAQSHQVLVLTCRERTFASLGGNRIAIAPWR
jgi:DNA repair exonuclease SbcCD ATPase subunit